MYCTIWGSIGGVEWNYNERVQGVFLRDETTLYLVCVDDSINLHMCQNVDTPKEKVNFTL